MKKNYLSALILGSAIALAVAGNAFAQTATTSPAENISRASTVIATVGQIDVQRKNISASVTDSLNAIVVQTRGLASMALTTEEARESASMQLQTISSQINTLTPLIAGLNGVRNGEIALLGIARNYLILANNELST